jgi:hypothetical protein
MNGFGSGAHVTLLHAIRLLVSLLRVINAAHMCVDAVLDRRLGRGYVGEGSCPACCITRPRPRADAWGESALACPTQDTRGMGPNKHNCPLGTTWWWAFPIGRSKKKNKRTPTRGVGVGCCWHTTPWQKQAGGLITSKSGPGSQHAAGLRTGPTNRSWFLVRAASSKPPSLNEGRGARWGLGGGGGVAVASNEHVGSNGTALHEGKRAGGGGEGRAGRKVGGGTIQGRKVDVVLEEKVIN